MDQCVGIVIGLLVGLVLAVRLTIAFEKSPVEADKILKPFITKYVFGGAVGGGVFAGVLKFFGQLGVDAKKAVPAYVVSLGAPLIVTLFIYWIRMISASTKYQRKADRLPPADGKKLMALLGPAKDRQKLDLSEAEIRRLLSLMAKKDDEG